jgi:hypothetical protein
MIGRDEERLIQDVLDGQASPAEVERLKAWLAVSEEGRTRMRELEGLFATLDRVPFAEMPQGLENEIEQAIRARAGTRPHRVPSLRVPTRTRLAMVFAAGIAAGVIGWGALTGILNPGTPGRERVVGSMMPTTPPQAPTSERTWKAGDTRLQAVAWRSGSSRWLRLRLEGRTPTEIELRFDPGALSPVAVRQSNHASRVALDPGRVLIRAGSGGEFTFELGERSTSEGIQVSVRAAGGTVTDVLPAP